MKTLKTIKILLAGAVSLASAVVANAGTNISGTLGFGPFGTGGSYTTNSVDFIVGSTTPVANSVTGDFVGLVGAFDLTAPFAVSIYSAPVSAIPFNTPAPIAISNFITFGSGAGPTPQRFSFDLTSIKTILANGSAGQGFGVMRDTLGTYNDANAAFTYSFVSPTNYSISFAASPFPTPIPEPSTYAAIIGVMTLGIVANRRRKRAAA
jgi:hypothetical protein